MSNILVQFADVIKDLQNTHKSTWELKVRNYEYAIFDYREDYNTTPTTSKERNLSCSEIYWNDQISGTDIYNRSSINRWLNDMEPDLQNQAVKEITEMFEIFGSSVRIVGRN